MQALPATAESLCIVEMGGVETGDKVVGGGLFLNIGLNVSAVLEISNSFSLVFQMGI